MWPRPRTRSRPGRPKWIRNKRQSLFCSRATHSRAIRFRARSKAASRLVQSLQLRCRGLLLRRLWTVRGRTGALTLLPSSTQRALSRFSHRGGGILGIQSRLVGRNYSGHPTRDCISKGKAVSLGSRTAQPAGNEEASFCQAHLILCVCSVCGARWMLCFNRYLLKPLCQPPRETPCVDTTAGLLCGVEGLCTVQGTMLIRNRPPP